MNLISPILVWALFFAAQSANGIAARFHPKKVQVQLDLFRDHALVGYDDSPKNDTKLIYVRNKGIVAYKEERNGLCLLERIAKHHQYTHRPGRVQYSRVYRIFTFLPDERQVEKLAGKTILIFCSGYPIILMSNDIGKDRRKRDSTGATREASRKLLEDLADAVIDLNPGRGRKRNAADDLRHFGPFREHSSGQAADIDYRTRIRNDIHPVSLVHPIDITSSVTVTTGSAPRHSWSHTPSTHHNGTRGDHSAEEAFHPRSANDTGASASGDHLHPVDVHHSSSSGNVHPSHRFSPSSSAGHDPYPSSSSAGPQQSSLFPPSSGSRVQSPLGPGPYPPSSFAKSPSFPPSSADKTNSNRDHYSPSSVAKPHSTPYTPHPPSAGNVHLHSSHGQYPPSSSAKYHSTAYFIPSSTSTARLGPAHYQPSSISNTQSGHGFYPPSSTSKTQSGRQYHAQSSASSTQSGPAHYQPSSTSNTQSNQDHYPPSSTVRTESDQKLNYPPSSTSKSQSGQGYYPPSTSNNQLGQQQYPPFFDDNQRSNPFFPPSSTSKSGQQYYPPSSTSKSGQANYPPSSTGRTHSSQTPTATHQMHPAPLFPPSSASKTQTGHTYYPSSSTSITHSARYSPSSTPKPHSTSYFPSSSTGKVRSDQQHLPPSSHGQAQSTSYFSPSSKVGLGQRHHYRMNWAHSSFPHSSEIETHPPRERYPPSGGQSPREYHSVGQQYTPTETFSQQRGHHPAYAHPSSANSPHQPGTLYSASKHVDAVYAPRYPPSSIPKYYGSPTLSPASDHSPSSSGKFHPTTPEKTHPPSHRSPSDYPTTSRGQVHLPYSPTHPQYPYQGYPPSSTSKQHGPFSPSHRLPPSPHPYPGGSAASHTSSGHSTEAGSYPPSSSHRSTGDAPYYGPSSASRGQPDGSPAHPPPAAAKTHPQHFHRYPPSASTDRDESFLRPPEQIDGSQHLPPTRDAPDGSGTGTIRHLSQHRRHPSDNFYPPSSGNDPESARERPRTPGQLEIVSTVTVTPRPAYAYSPLTPPHFPYSPHSPDRGSLRNETFSSGNLPRYAPDYPSTSSAAENHRRPHYPPSSSSRTSSSPCTPRSTYSITTKTVLARNGVVHRTEDDSPCTGPPRTGAVCSNSPRSRVPCHGNQKTGAGTQTTLPGAASQAELLHGVRPSTLRSHQPFSKLISENSTSSELTTSRDREGTDVESVEEDDGESTGKHPEDEAQLPEDETPKEDEEEVKEGDLLEPGDRILGKDGYTISDGFRGRVVSVTGLIGKTRTDAGTSNSSYGQFKYSSQLGRYVKEDGGKNYSNCSGELTFACTEFLGSNGRAKICKPNPRRKPDGSPC